MRFHPATYIFFIVSIVNLLSLRIIYWRVLFAWPYAPFTFMTIMFILRGIMIAKASDDPTGAVGIAITNFLTPILLVISSPRMALRDWRRVGVLVRFLVILSSMLALVESVTHYSLFFVQTGRIFRAGGLIGHPLASGLVTGCMITYLLTATNHRNYLAALLPEVILHSAALFAYGGRTGLVLVPMVVAASIILPSPGVPIKQRIIQRIAVVAILASALLMTQMNIDFIQSGLSRFTSDSGSADTRYAALEMVSHLPPGDFLFGVSAAEKTHLMMIYDTEIAFENPWVTLILIFGGAFVLPMAISVLVLLFSWCRSLDRSAAIMVTYFLIATSGYVSFGSKSVTIVQIVAMITALCQPKYKDLSFSEAELDLDPDIV